MKISEIISEADVLVPNAFTTSEKIPWLNAINQEFFDVVKIPKYATFNPSPSVTLPSDIRAKNIDYLRIGNIRYRNFLTEDVKPKELHFIFDDESSTLTLSSVGDGMGQIRYFRIPTSIFTTSNLNAEPDAPLEYHWIYVVGLCERIAKANGDTVRANNYGQDYQNALRVAAQNYAKGETA